MKVKSYLFKTMKYILFLTCFFNYAYAADFEWSQAFEHGIYESSLSNNDGYTITMSCYAYSNYGGMVSGPSIILEKNEKYLIPSGKKIFKFRIKNFNYIIENRISSKENDKLWTDFLSALRKNKEFIVYMNNKYISTFTYNAKGATILDLEECLAPANAQE